MLHNYPSLYLVTNCFVTFFSFIAGESSILFSDAVVKINRRGRMQERWLMITGVCVCACVLQKMLLLSSLLFVNRANRCVCVFFLL